MWVRKPPASFDIVPGMSFSETFLPEFNQEMVSTRKILAAVPDALFTWKPHEKSMALGRLASHVAEMPNWAYTTINTEKLVIEPDFKPFNAPSSAELLEGFDEYVAASRIALEGATDEHLSKTWTLVYGGQTLMSMPRVAVLRNMVMNHMIHHRGQISVYLRLQNIPVPGMYGASADEKLLGT
jgi:uncharacterized damage-inducible protein DinB